MCRVGLGEISMFSLPLHILNLRVDDEYVDSATLQVGLRLTF
jgi:hypothetical protein